MVGVGSTPAVLFVLSLFCLAILFGFIANCLPVALKDEVVNMGKYAFLVVTIFQVTSGWFMGMGINATGVVTPLT